MVYQFDYPFTDNQTRGHPEWCTGKLGNYINVNFNGVSDVKIYSLNMHSSEITICENNYVKRHV